MKLSKVFFLTSLSVLCLGSDAKAASACFNKPVTRVLGKNDTTHKLSYGEVVFVLGTNTKVKGGPESIICAGSGRQIIYAGKGISKTSTGAGNDEIHLAEASYRSIAISGPGNDKIYGSRGSDKIISSGYSPDNDTIFSYGGNNKIFDYQGANEIHAGNGSDKI